MTIYIVIIGLLIMIIGFLFWELKKDKKPNDNIEKKIDQIQQKNNEQMVNLINNFENKLNNQTLYTNQQINQLVGNLDSKITAQSSTSMQQLRETLNSVEKKINHQNSEANDNIKTVIERVTKLDTAQKQMLNLSDSINNLEKVLTDKKTRGTFGEQQLNNIFSAVYGVNKELYETQALLPNGKQVDLLLHSPEPLGDIAIDSKFPLENYLLMTNGDNEQIINDATKKFKIDVKKHINDISDKYIIDGITANQAIMFIPAEAIFSELYANHNDLIEYSYSKKVWITSPTTLLAILTLLQVVLKDLKRSKNSKLIQDELIRLSVEFDRFTKRWDNLERHLETVSKDAKELSTTSNKITNRFSSIEKVELDLNIDN